MNCLKEIFSRFSNLTTIDLFSFGDCFLTEYEENALEKLIEFTPNLIEIIIDSEEILDFRATLSTYISSTKKNKPRWKHLKDIYCYNEHFMKEFKKVFGECRDLVSIGYQYETEGETLPIHHSFGFNVDFITQTFRTNLRELIISCVADNDFDFIFLWNYFESLELLHLQTVCGVGCASHEGHPQPFSLFLEPAPNMASRSGDWKERKLAAKTFQSTDLAARFCQCHGSKKIAVCRPNTL